MSAAAVFTPASLAGAEPGDEPGRPSVDAVNSRVDRLHEQAEAASEKYNGAAERTARLRKQVERLQDSAARGQAEVNRMRGELAGVAGAQYRSGGIDPSLALLLTSDPGSYLDRAATLDRVGSVQSARLDRLTEARRTLEQRRVEASGKLDELRSEQRELQRHKKDVRKKLGTAKRLLGQLTEEETRQRERAEQQERKRASREAARRPAASSAGGKSAPNKRAATAVSAVRSALGAPYSWGASGPDSFDCSGLTQWAYERAGVALPRTSQGQQSAGKRVSLEQAKPGDLVVYRKDASHVGMYVGNGQVVHAPKPGANVRYEPVGMMPVASVTRP